MLAEESISIQQTDDDDEDYFPYHSLSDGRMVNILRIDVDSGFKGMSPGLKRYAIYYSLSSRKKMGHKLLDLELKVGKPIKQIVQATDIDSSINKLLHYLNFTQAA